MITKIQNITKIRMNRKMALILSILIFHNMIFGQDAVSGMKLVRDFHNKIDNVSFPEKGKAYHFQYHVKNEYRNIPDKPVEEADIEIVMTQDMMLNYTKDVDLLRDNTDGFMIIRPQKIIFRTNSYIRPDKEKRLSEIVGIRDSILDLCKVISCKNVKQDEKNYTVITLEPEKKVKDMFQIEKFIYWYDIEKEKMWKVITEMTEENSVKRSTNTMVDINLNYKKKYNLPVKTMVLDSKGNLLQKYHGYNLIDNRE